MSKPFLIVGSQAIKHHYPDFPRTPHDTDIIVSRETYESAISNKDDIEGIQERRGFSSIVKFKGLGYIEYFIADDVESFKVLLENGGNESYASPEVLYSMKKSHIHYPLRFEKHIHDYLFLREKLRQEKDLSLEDDLNSHLDWCDELPIFTALHKKCVEQVFGELRTPKMTESKSKFFGKSKKYVTSYYVHDDMHKAIALMHAGDPVYQQILADGAEVETDLLKWSKLSLQHKIWCVLEEVYVIALERKIIPPLFEGGLGLTPKQAFDWALMRVCTTLCDGFFREFATRAYNEIQKQYNPDYVHLFFKNISQYDTNYDKTEGDRRASKAEIQDN